MVGSKPPLKLHAFLFIALFFVFGNAFAQQEMEILPLKSRSPDQVLPVLLPMLEPGGVLTAANQQIFLRASKRNREEIKRVLAAIDLPLRQLIIRVSQTRDAGDSNRGGNVDGRLVVGSKTSVDARARVWDTRSQRQESGSQMIQTVEGGKAFIQIGHSLPLPMRQVSYGPQGTVVTDTVVYHDIGQGFYAEPHLAGDRVTLEISQQSDTLLNSRSGVAQVQRLSTTVSGRLGEWIQLGGSGQQKSGDERGALSLSTRELRDTRSIWLKVDEVQ